MHRPNEAIAAAQRRCESSSFMFSLFLDVKFTLVNVIMRTSHNSR